MLDILAVTGPVYLAIALGFGATHWGLFDKAELRVLGKFVLQVALPALLFNAMATRRVGDIFNAAYGLVYLVATYTMIGLGWLPCSAPALSCSFPLSLLELKHSARDTFSGGKLTVPAQRSRERKS